MLIARATTKAGNDLLIIGLSDENRRKLEAGKPIDISCRTHGETIPRQLHLVIFAGHDEETMQAEMQELIGKDTVIDRSRGAQ